MHKIILILLLTAFCPPNTNEVIKVIDGDTIKVSEYDEDVRILGIDTFEVHRDQRLKKQSLRADISLTEALWLGYAGKAQAEKTLLNKCVYLESDIKDIGRYGRYLRYVELDNLDYSEFMLKNELAMPYCGDKKLSRFKYYNEVSKKEWRCGK